MYENTGGAMVTGALDLIVLHTLLLNRFICLNAHIVSDLDLR